MATTRTSQKPESNSVNAASLDRISRAVYEAVVDEVALSVGAAIKDALSDLEQKFMGMIRQEVEHRVKSLVSSYEVKVLQIRDDYVKSLEYVVKNIPVPVVNVEQPKVNVSIPQDAIAVRVEHQLNLPNKKTKTEKSVVYGPTGRPEKIVEETTEE